MEAYLISKGKDVISLFIKSTFPGLKPGSSGVGSGMFAFAGLS